MRLWLGITLLIIVAFAWKRLRDRRVLRRWEEEDPAPPPPRPEETVH